MVEMKLVTKIGTGAAVAVFGGGVAAGIAFSGGHSTAPQSVVVRQVAATVSVSATPTHSASAVVLAPRAVTVKPVAKPQVVAPVQQPVQQAPIQQPVAADVTPTDTTSPAPSSSGADVAPPNEQGSVGPDGQLRPATAPPGPSFETNPAPQPAPTPTH